MNTMVLDEYNQFLEPCCICDSEHTVIGIKEREALGDTKFTYQQLLIRCLDCGFEFVNKELSAQTLRNRDRAEMMLKLSLTTIKDAYQSRRVSFDYTIEVDRGLQKGSGIINNIYTHRIPTVNYRTTISSFSSIDQSIFTLDNQLPPRHSTYVR